MQQFTFWVLIIAAALYASAAFGFYWQGKWEMGTAFAAYGIANLVFARL